VRFCAVPFDGFPAEPGPPDALVEGLGSFSDAVAALPAADPSRCAAVEVLPTDSRLLFELADGSLASMPTADCQDATVVDRTVDAADVTDAFLDALDAQRDEFDYTMAEPQPQPSCDEPPTLLRLAEPGRESLVAATWCPAAGQDDRFGPDGLAVVADVWRLAVADGNRLDPCVDDAALPDIIARTDRGDVIHVYTCPADRLIYLGWSGVYEGPLSSEALLSAS
jgi:hypothetical protein